VVETELSKLKEELGMKGSFPQEEVLHRMV
jgi:hypothetical protein